MHTDIDVRITEDIKTVIIVFHVLKKVEDRLNVLQRHANYKKNIYIRLLEVKTIMSTVFS